MPAAGAHKNVIGGLRRHMGETRALRHRDCSWLADGKSEKTILNSAAHCITSTCSRYAMRVEGDNTSDSELEGEALAERMARGPPLLAPSQLTAYVRGLRRRRAATAARPVPSRSSDAGSGTTDGSP